MADAVDTKVVYQGGRTYVVHMQNDSDGTGENAVTKVDISTLTNGLGQVPTHTTIDRIEYSVWGMNGVQLLWDHTTDDEIALLYGQGLIDWTEAGGNTDPRTTGGTGDILLTTVGATASGGYDITLWLRLKA